MSEPKIGEFSARIAFNPDGVPIGVQYDCRVCDRLGPDIDATAQIGDLVHAHLGHAQVAHDLYPPTLCSAEYRIPGVGASVRCEIEDPQHEGKHRFSW